jgi:hypothetical protein
MVEMGVDKTVNKLLHLYHKIVTGITVMFLKALAPWAIHLERGGV